MPTATDHGRRCPGRGPTVRGALRRGGRRRGSEPRADRTAPARSSPSSPTPRPSIGWSRCSWTTPAGTPDPEEPSSSAWPAPAARSPSGGRFRSGDPGRSTGAGPRPVPPCGRPAGRDRSRAGHRRRGGALDPRPLVDRGLAARGRPHGGVLAGGQRSRSGGRRTPPDGVPPRRIDQGRPPSESSLTSIGGSANQAVFFDFSYACVMLASGCAPYAGRHGHPEPTPGVGVARRRTRPAHRRRAGVPAVVARRLTVEWVP